PPRLSSRTFLSSVCRCSSRPGRPPKRTQSVTSPENPHIMPHSVPGLMSPGMMPPTGNLVFLGGQIGCVAINCGSSHKLESIRELHCGTPPERHLICGGNLSHKQPRGLTAAAAAAANAAIAEAMKVKKIKLEAMSGYHGNANHHGADGENGDLSSGVGEDALYTHAPSQTHLHSH
ncbi:hypothetical protein ILYODFUR_002696, partial [Ilyodon furcidens]